MQLRVENLTAGYVGKRVLQDVSVSFPVGQVTALLGPNGCGKSTLLKSLARLLVPSQGEVLVGDQPLARFSARQLARHLALLPQQHLTPEGVSVAELVAYGRHPWLPLWGRLSVQDRAQVQVAMERMGVDHLAPQRVSDLSGGQRQRVFLAMLLAQDTPIVLLDEPTTWLDINHQIELMKLMGELKAQGKTVVTVLHDLNQASRYCDQLVLLAQGALVTQGTPAQVLQPGILKRVFQVDVAVVPEPLSGALMCVHYDN
ncbi:Iron(III) dicitrate transport ATP-binding protein FecE [Pantoea sp. AS-PWVM4]|uniref:Fe(3+) dicitrate ABC transporter ATP-binding protein FecE n=1 Tax=Pantoea sp. AS-PWVM4 TaxID=1332069 RepID=UPI0003AC64FD|nr:Fe(3+) dicitrate ABC transporter ATP-binding protein FecE [Pantoea sp. AS-PWVM4]ERK09524.1 Iron(III) dicitrate transport ATP-binding protein FecE [Pantoea sp. AS-PWVM4]